MVFEVYLILYIFFIFPLFKGQYILTHCAEFLLFLSFVKDYYFFSEKILDKNLSFLNQNL